MHNEYPQELVDSIIKPLRSSCPPDTIYQGMVIIPYGMVSPRNLDALETISVLTIFKTKHTLGGTLMKT
jgi:hypothetical protein